MMIFDEISTNALFTHDRDGQSESVYEKCNNDRKKRRENSFNVAPDRTDM